MVANESRLGNVQEGQEAGKNSRPVQRSQGQGAMDRKQKMAYGLSRILNCELILKLKVKRLDADFSSG